MKVGLYKLAEGSYQVSYKDSDNKRIRRQFVSHRAAKIYADRIFLRPLKNEHRPEPITSSTKTVTELLSDYLARNPESPIKKRGQELLDSFKSYFDKLNPKDLNKVLCSHWLDSIKTERKYTSRSMRICKYAYSSFFQDLVEQGLIERNYLAEICIRLGTRVKQKTFLSESELKTILAGLKKLSPSETYPATYFLIHTGCKISEALALKREDLDLEAGTVYFPRKPSANARTINLSPNILEFLKQHPKNAANVFLNGQGAAWTTKGYYKRMVIDRAALDLGRHWDSFTFRHTFAYHFLRKGKTLQQLQVVIGHRNIADTILAYGNVVSEKDEKSSPY